MKNFIVFILLLVILGFGGFSFFNLIKNENAIYNQNTVSNFDCNGTKISAQKILILSETTHGSENINELKNCLFKRLIISKKYDTLVFEYDYSVMNIVDSYINNRINLNESELRGFIYNSFYNSVSFFDLIEFLRIYNQENSHKIRVFGIDNTELTGLYFLISKNSEINQETYNCIKSNYTSLDFVSKNCLNGYEFDKITLNKNEYLLTLLKRVIDNTNLDKKYSNGQRFNEDNRDLNMFKTFNDIYKNYPERKFIFSIHAGHSLNLSNRFGSYMKNSTYKFDNYIISLCSGEITAYREISKGFYTLFVPALKGNSIESAVCNGKNPDPEKNNKLFRFTSMYSSDVTMTIPDYGFNGFIVIKKSLPLVFSKK